MSTKLSAYQQDSKLSLTEGVEKAAIETSPTEKSAVEERDAVDATIEPANPLKPLVDKAVADAAKCHSEKCME